MRIIKELIPINILRAQRVTFFFLLSRDFGIAFDHLSFFSEREWGERERHIDSRKMEDTITLTYWKVRALRKRERNKASERKRDRLTGRQILMHGSYGDIIRRLKKATAAISFIIFH